LGTLDEDGMKVFNSLEGRTLREKLDTNCCRLNYSNGLEGGTHALFVKFAKVNHSCRPNIVHIIDAGVITLVAQKNIKAGEEILTSYFFPQTDILFGKLKRNHSLAKHRIANNIPPFDCLCEVCCASERDINVSDSCRKLIDEAQQNFLSNPASNVESLAPLLKPLLFYAQKEGLPNYYAFGERVLAKLSSIHGEQSSIKDGSDKFDGKRLESHLECEVKLRAFKVGAKVFLFKLKARPDLNGRTGTVVKKFNAKTGRIGVMLDEIDGEMVGKPIALN
jgi:hypothetical protein